MAAHNTTVPFTVEAAPGTDIWRKPGHNAWSIPSVHTSSGPLKSFLSVRATFSANWESLYDQSGVLLVPRRASDAAAPNSKWVKTGIELYDGRPHLSTVTCDRYADWGLYPLTTAADASADVKSVTIEVFRDGGAGGKNAWVHRLVLDDDGNVKERVPLRKICWIFADEDEGDWVLDVGPLAARPDKAAQDVLKVEFSEFTVQWSQ
ncbi:hypothetical protein ColTof4_05078 [Colletotrichum tofieldiae]|uniref:Uncharacterized protein n=1 Tax=Colletotrichum tofieldiae TaxID=708197 RepID=A0A161VPM1_9PEZI|nr:hypothetical protein CT0861_06811 [Colletotrichum tofieldiae]GKT63334.1 hypothetical protein ColTof3_10673 [Colletotrichum tofieldiae]GKT72655.1 hypothetical protein ColTof4_05078 [Colletotrichum tofieldiae]